jgi:hypothetical protein
VFPPEGDEVSAENICDLTGFRQHSIHSRASLKNIRRIRISCGNPDHSRKQHHISGLLLEYNDNSDSQIVGQWIAEVEAWEFSLNEKIVAVSLVSSADHVGHIEVSGNFYYDDVRSEFKAKSRPKFGTIIGLRIETTFSLFERIVHIPTASIVWNFRNNIFEELVSASYHVSND